MFEKNSIPFETGKTDLLARNIIMSYQISQGNSELQTQILSSYFTNNHDMLELGRHINSYSPEEVQKIKDTVIKIAKGPNHKKVEEEDVNYESSRFSNYLELGEPASPLEIGLNILDRDATYLREGRPRVRSDTSQLVQYGLIEPCYDATKVESIATVSFTAVMDELSDDTRLHPVDHLQITLLMANILESYNENFPALQPNIQPSLDSLNEVLSNKYSAGDLDI